MGVQEGQSTPRKTFPHLFPINKGCSSRDGGGDGTVASGGKVVIAGRGDGLLAQCWPCDQGKG